MDMSTPLSLQDLLQITSPLSEREMESARVGMHRVLLRYVDKYLAAQSDTVFAVLEQQEVRCTIESMERKFRAIWEATQGDEAQRSALIRLCLLQIAERA